MSLRGVTMIVIDPNADIVTLDYGLTAHRPAATMDNPPAQARRPRWTIEISYRTNPEFNRETTCPSGGTMLPGAIALPAMKPPPQSKKIEDTIPDASHAVTMLDGMPGQSVASARRSNGRTWQNRSFEPGLAGLTSPRH
ncbi:hypothetical protein BH24CHL4_BH24CHL4_10270 [soil metagenome]